MNAFEDALDILFLDDNLAVDAEYVPAGSAGGTPCRIALVRPDTSVELGETRAVTASVIVEVRSSEVASPLRGDRFVTGAVTYEVTAKPQRSDVDRHLWRCEAVEVAT